MKPNTLRLSLVTGLVGLSLVLFLIQNLVFHDTRNTVFYLLQDVAFLPLQVMLVTLILERVLSSMERQERIKKQNMVIGTFFSQCGVALLKRFAAWDPSIESVRAELLVDKTWDDGRFRSLSTRLTRYRSGLRAGDVDFGTLMGVLEAQRGFLLGLLENQNLLEHEDFTELLWATFHLLEELAYREDFRGLPPSDLDHLAGDLNRAYALLIRQWIAYMRHLKKDYPYLFSFALRTNPFDPRARIEVS